MTLLVIEDEPSVRDLIALTLRGEGFAVHTAADGRAALTMIAEAPPRAILLDVNMPQMDGFSFLEAMRNDPARRDIPVLMLTARGEPSDVRRALALGARDYIGKPFEPKQLLRRVRRLLAT